VAQRPDGEQPQDREDPDPDPLTKAIEGLTLRGIGPAFMGGRIADVAVHPRDRSTWYVAVGSGGLWKTVNAGTTWTPVFDEQPAYSIGCVTIDPTRPEIVWVGTGEAVSGRHVAWGDGVHRSGDGGATWTRMGLERSEHVADILVDPRDGDVVYVAAEGPLWSAGGDRGLYKTTDGGGAWEAVLTVDDRTGVTSACFAPDDPDTVYAATYQRRRSVRSFVGGGPGSGIHVSPDGGATWDRITEGLPKGEMGKIGLAVTPADPDLVYATVEAAEEKERGFYRSTTRGRTWARRCGYLSSGTGPHYYQEIFASPVDRDRVYQVDVFLHRTTDGGATFHNVEEKGADKHSDNHVVWIDPDPAQRGRHLLVGTDGGLYETFDEGGTWRHTSNLPISQFYRVAVDGSTPFTNVLGGAQDLGTLFGPTRTAHVDGVRNQDWYVPLGADGYHTAFDPDDPDLAYLEWQGGNVMRLDRRTHELTDIKPQPAPGDPPERWNWDTPIVIGPHRPGRIYVGSQRVWRSDDRGDSWTAISPDLTTGRNRYALPTGERVWSVDALYDPFAMSEYATITDISESPVTEGVLYVGTDDGLLQVSEDGGVTWRRAAAPDELPPDAFVNDVEASRHDGGGLFVVADDHKSGDYRPHLYESPDRGRTWRSIRGDLPDGVIGWSIEQDHVNPDLLFLGAENGLYASLDRGEHWLRLGGKSVPTISFRDLAIQRRDDDLIGATFGRGFFVLDDYSPLRTITPGGLEAPATLFPVRDAWRYVPYLPGQAKGQPTLGSTAFRAPNPPFGAIVTYHLSADLQTAKQRRRVEEEPLDEAGDDVPFPGWDRLWEEHLEADPTVLLMIRDAGGGPVRTLWAEGKAGLHRTAWDLRLPPPDPVTIDEPEFQPPWVSPPQGPLAPAGRYTVELVHVRPGGDGADGGVTVEVLAGPEGFNVVDSPGSAAARAPFGGSGTLDPGDHGFARATADLARRVAGAAGRTVDARDRVRHLRAGVAATPGAGPELFARLDAAHRELEELRRRLVGDPVRRKLGEADEPSIQDLVGRVAALHWDTTGPPTATQRSAVARAADAFEPLARELADLVDRLTALAADLDAAGGPWTPR